MKRALGAVMLAGLVLPAAASAHARLVFATPANGQVLPTAPTAAVLRFDERVAVGPGNAIVDGSGHSVVDGVPRTHGHELTVPLQHLGDGSYTLRWSVVSDDGHDVSGIVAFAVGNATPHATLHARSENPGPTDVGERWLLLAGILIAGGAALFALAVERRRPVVLLAGGGHAAALAGAAFEWGRVPHGTRFGEAMLVVAIAALAGLAAAAVSALRAGVAPLLVVSAATAIVATSVGGHALDPGVPRYQVAVDALHLAAASVWVGGLASLVLARAGARRFSRIALVSVGVIAATGVLRAVSELSAVHQLWSTGYGNVLIAKTALLAGLVALGYRSRGRVLGAVRDLRRSVAAELGLAGLLVVAVAILTAVAPGRVTGASTAVTAPAGSGAPPAPPAGAVTLARQVGGFGVAVAVSPGTKTVPVQVTVLGAQGNGVDGLAVRIAGHGASRCGLGCYTATVPATRALVVAVGARTATFGLPAQPFRNGMPMLKRIGQRLLRARTVAFRERLSSGPGQVVMSQWRLEAPASLSFTASDGSSGVIVGGRRWDKQRGGRWVESPQTPRVRQPQLPWPAFPSNVVDLGAGVVAGRKVERVSFLDPATPAWYTVTADVRTHGVVRVDMVAPAHFMTDTYTGLDEPFRIRPPR